MTARALSSATLGAPLSPLPSRLSLDFLYFQCYETKHLGASSLPHSPLHRQLLLHMCTVAEIIRSIHTSSLDAAASPTNSKPRPLGTHSRAPAIL